MQPCYVAAEVIKTVAAGFPGAVKVDAFQAFHDVYMVRDLEIRHPGLAMALYFDILAVVPSDRHGIVDYVGDQQHPFPDFILQLFLKLCQFFKLPVYPDDLRLVLLGFFFKPLGHERAYSLADGIALAPEIVAAGFRFPELPVQFQDLVDKSRFIMLEFLPHVFLHTFGFRPDKPDIDHFPSSFCCLPSSVSKNLPAPHIAWDGRYPRCHPNCRSKGPTTHRYFKGYQPPAHHRQLRKRKDPAFCRFAPATGSLSEGSWTISSFTAVKHMVQVFQYSISL